MGSLMTTVSQDLGLTSHPKDGISYSAVSPSRHWGIGIDLFGQREECHLLATHQHHFQQQPSFPRRTPIGRSWYCSIDQSRRASSDAGPVGQAGGPLPPSQASSESPAGQAGAYPSHRLHRPVQHHLPDSKQ
ncbi:hypothetical protein AALO_G00195350 [Alosa alosa]|uniref:Uncharacterized protein n=1 Tax=Alosa alosa TaxID=278164 RepID=A0AAV6GBA1_9TELE|nr:hypothetical protein AALO_G00195350 [Alosa alosa]